MENLRNYIRGRQRSSAEKTATNLLLVGGLAAAGVAAARSSFGRNILREVGELGESRIARTLGSFRRNYDPVNNLSGLTMKQAETNFFGGRLRPQSISISESKLGGLHGLFPTYREQMRAGRDLQAMSLRDRLKFSWEWRKGAVQEFGRQARNLWEFHGSRAGRARPGRSAIAPVRAAAESLHAATELTADESYLKTFRPPRVRPSGLVNAEDFTGLSDDVLDIPGQFGTTSNRVVATAFDKILDQVGKVFETAPKMGLMARTFAGKKFAPETFQDYLSSNTAATFKYQYLKQGRELTANVPREILEYMSEGRTLYTGRFRALDGEVWDPRATTPMAGFRALLNAVQDVQVPIVGWKPAHLFMPKVMFAGFDANAPFVEAMAGGRELAIRNGTTSIPMFSKTPLGKIWGSTGLENPFEVHAYDRFRPNFGMVDPDRSLGVIGNLGKKTPYQYKDARKLEHRRQLLNLARYKQSPDSNVDELFQQYMAANPNLSRRVAFSQFMRVAPKMEGNVPHSLLKETVSSIGLSQALEPFSFTGVTGLKVVGRGRVMVPNETYAGRALHMVRGQQVWAPIPDEYLAHAFAGGDVVSGASGILSAQGRVTWRERALAGIVKGLSKVGIDWRNQRTKPVPFRLLEIANSLMGGMDRLPLHMEDWKLASGDRASGHMAKWGGKMTSQHALDTIHAREMAITDLELSNMYSGSRMSPRPFDGDSVATFGRQQDLLENLIAKRATKLASEGKSLSELSGTYYDPGTGITHQNVGRIHHDGKDYRFQWRSSTKRVLSEKTEWTTASPQDVARAGYTWLTHRPLELLNAMGLGGHAEHTMRGPGKVAGMLAGRLAQMYYGMKGLEYIDYKIEQITGLSPIKMGVGAVAGLDIARHALVSPIGQTMEHILPGSATSPLSHAARSFGIPLAGIVATGFTGNPMFALGGLAGGLAFGGDITRGAGEQADIYSGEQPVPIRKGRFWEFSRGSFFGNDVMQYRPHWMARVMHQPKYQGYPYASAQHYWSSQAFVPVPENWFGLRNFFQPYAHDEYLQSIGAPTVYSSPHPITQIPVAGPLLTPIGALLKPARRMHPDIPLPTEPAEEAAGRQALLSLAQQSNLRLEEGGMAGPANVKGPYSMTTAAQRALRFAEEMPGIYGWASFTTARKFLGVQEPGGYRYETAADDVGMLPDYWEMELGGMFGATELIRRLLPKKRYQDQVISNIPNQMPSWLPGGNDYYGKDFHTGNPFAKIPMGEYVLPGGGYESRYDELQGKSPEDYPTWARLEVLTSASPFSRQAREAARQLEAGIQSGTAGKREQRILKQFYERTGDPEFYDTVSIGAMSAPFGIRGGKLTNRADTLREYLSTRIYGPAIERWENPMSDFVQPAFRMMGHDGPIRGTIEGGVLGAAFGGNVVTSAAGAMLGAALGVVASGREAFYQAATGEKFVPFETRRRWEITEYFDRLRFVKSMHLYKQSSNPVFLESAKRTAYGVDPFGPHWQVMTSLPAADRDFVAAFLQADKEKDRKKILAATPDYIDRILAAQWTTRDIQALSAQMLDGGLSQTKMNQLQNQRTELENLRRASQEQQQARLANSDGGLDRYFGEYYLPPESWAGWAVDVPIEAAMATVVENEGLSAEEFDIWRTEQNRYDRMKNQIIVPPVGTRTPGGSFGARRRLRDLLSPGSRMFESFSMTAGPEDNYSTNVTLSRSDYADVRAFVRYGL